MIRSKSGRRRTTWRTKLVHGHPRVEIHRVETVFRRGGSGRLAERFPHRLADADEKGLVTRLRSEGGESLRNDALADPALAQDEEGSVEIDGEIAADRLVGGPPGQVSRYFRRVSIERRPSVESGK